MRNKYVFVTAMLCCILLVSMGITSIYVSHQEGDSNSKEDIVIVTSFYPMYIATQNIVEGLEDIPEKDDKSGICLKNLSEPQTGCLHDFQLTPEDMKLLSTADIFVINGGGIETFIEDVAKAYPNLTIINACENLSLIEEHDADEEEHEEAHEEHEEAHTHGEVHEHGEENAHAWMSVACYRKQVDTIAAHLEEELPQFADTFQNNALQYDTKLKELQKQQEEIKAITQGKSVILFHEAYAYVAQEYGMQVSYVMDLDEERQVSAGEVADVLNAIDKDNVSMILAEELYGKDMGNTIQKEKEVEVVYLNALNRGDYEKDSYLQGMQDNLNRLKQVLKN